MQITINGHTYGMWNRVNVNLKFDHVTDTFSFKLYFDPDNAQHKEDFRPGQYPIIKIWKGNVLVMTGMILSYRFGSAGDPPKQLVDISGFCVTGMLDKSCILNTIYAEPGNPASVDAVGQQVLYATSNTVIIPPSPLQFDNRTLPSIASAVTSFYGLTVKVDAELLNDLVFMAPFPTVMAGPDVGDHPEDPTGTTPDMTVYRFLKGLCDQKNVVLSHDQHGNVVITRVKVDKVVTTQATYVRENVLSSSKRDVFDDPGDVFDDPGDVYRSQIVTATSRPILYAFDETNRATWLTMDLNFDGQDMHRFIQIVGQKNQEADNSLDDATTNPFVAAGTTLYTRIIKTAGKDSDIGDTARSQLGSELESIELIIEIVGWTLGGNLVVPNQLITVVNKDLHLYNRTTWFIKEVDFYGDEKLKTALITCVIPACYGNDPVVNNYF